MQMMYETIYNALADEGLETEHEPQDYLNFFCLGNREPDYSRFESSSIKNFNPNTPQGMIVDDEYIILGPANINQRSLEGTRDTEIAMGNISLFTRGLANKLIQKDRMSLWAEHTGTLEQCFENPESLECVKRVRWMGELNWQQFESDEMTPLLGHLLKYPVHVDRTGKVTPLPGCDTFPDMGGKIIGMFAGIQENLTI